MTLKLFRLLALMGAAMTLTALLGCGGGGQSTAEVAKTAQVRIAVLGRGAALERYRSLGSGDFDPSLGDAAPLRVAPALNGLTLGGVPLPSISTWGATSYVSVPAGDYVLPIPQGAAVAGALTQPIALLAGARITLTRSSLYEPWIAVSEPQDAAVSAADAEISVLSVVSTYDANVASIVPIEISNAAGALLKRVERGSLLTGVRVPVGDIRITAFAVSANGEIKRIFRSELFSLPAGSQWLGSLFLESTGGSSVQLVSKESALKVAADERVRLRFVNMSDSVLTSTIPYAGQPAAALLPTPYSIFDYFGASGETAVVRFAAQQSSDPMKTLTLPPLLPGRGYDMIILNAPAPDYVRGLLLPHVQFVKDGGPFCKDRFRVLNAIDPEQSVSLGMIFSNVGSSELQPVRPMTPSVIGPLQIGLGDRGCSLSTPPIAFLTVTNSVAGVEQRVPPAAGPAMRAVNALSSDLGMPLPSLVPAANAVLDASTPALHWRAINP